MSSYYDNDKQHASEYSLCYQNPDLLPKLPWSPDVKSRYSVAADNALSAVSIPDCCHNCVNK